MSSELYRRLKHFLSEEMRLSHSYQPVMIRTLLENGGEAAINKIANEFLREDRGQQEYYEQITWRMPGPVLTKRGIVERKGDRYVLIGELSDLGP